MDFDDWELTAEELDFLEQDALRQIAQRNSSVASTSSCTTSTSSSSQPKSQCRQPSQERSLSQQLPHLISGAPFDLSPSKPSARTSQNQIDTSSPKSRRLPASVAPKLAHDSANGCPKLSVKFFLHASGNVAAKFPYDQVLVHAFRKIPKASWNARERIWMFPITSLQSVEKVITEISGFIVEVENLDPLVRRAIAVASAAPDLRDRYDSIPDFLEAKLLPFQRDGVRFMLQHGGRALLADEMGLGKTLQAIAVTACVRESWPVLVLCPSSLRLHWATMIHQWLHIPPSDIVVVLSQWCGSNKCGFSIVSSNKGLVQLDGVFNIVSYDSVPKLQSALLSSEFQIVVADESHYLKNAQAKRTITALPVLQKAQYSILLSGTPALSRPIELFKQLEALRPNVYKNVHEYGNRYCKGGVFGVYQGSSNHEELHNLMKATVMIRRLKKDVLTELPVKRRQQVFLELAEKDMRQINALFREMQVLKAKIKNCNSEEDYNSLKLTEKNLINKIYIESAEAKIPAVLDYLGTVIEAGCKFLIFAHHQPMVEAIHQFLQNNKVGCIRIDGSTPASSRLAMVQDFQEKDSIKAAVLSIRAAGVGLTLTAASTVIFAELSWTPGDLIQAEDRAHRIGQVSSVNVYYLLANDTVDDIIWDVVQSKLENLGQVLDGQENMLEVSHSQPRSSPGKQQTLDAFMKRENVEARSSPAKQKTLDAFMKRCNNSEDTNSQPKVKLFRQEK